LRKYWGLPAAMLPRAMEAASRTSYCGSENKLITISGSAFSLYRSFTRPYSPIQSVPMICLSGLPFDLAKLTKVFSSWAPGPFPDLAIYARHRAPERCLVLIASRRIVTTSLSIAFLSHATWKKYPSTWWVSVPDWIISEDANLLTDLTTFLQPVGLTLVMRLVHTLMARVAFMRSDSSMRGASSL